MFFYKILPVVNNNQMEGTASENFYTGLSFHFVTKNGKLLVIIFLHFLNISYDVSIDY